MMRLASAAGLWNTRLENLHNEFHGGVVVVVHQYPEQGRLPGAHRALFFGSGFVDNLLVAHCLMVH
jgi:hypothetical protein